MKEKPEVKTKTPEQNKFDETPRRTSHRYAMLLSQLGLSVQEMEGTSPEDAVRILQAKLAELKAEKTDYQVLANEGETVMLGGKEYEIAPLTIGADLKWRKQCGKIAADLVDHLMSFVTVQQEIRKGLPALPKKADASDEEIAKAQQARNAAFKEKMGKRMTEIFQEILPYIMGEGLDKIIELLFLYSEELEQNREAIMKESTALEITTAAMAGMRVAFPFVITLVKGLMAAFNKFQQAGLVKIPKVV